MLASGPRTGRVSGINGSGFCRSAIRLRTTRFTGGNSILPARSNISSNPRHTISRHAPFGLLPLPGLAEFARQLPAAQLRMIRDELPDEEDLFGGDIPAPIPMCSHLIRSVPESISERK
jgi:hypothetical protein